MDSFWHLQKNLPEYCSQLKNYMLILFMANRIAFSLNTGVYLSSVASNFSSVFYALLILFIVFLTLYYKAVASESQNWLWGLTIYSWFETLSAFGGISSQIYNPITASILLITDIPLSIAYTVFAIEVRKFHTSTSPSNNAV